MSLERGKKLWNENGIQRSMTRCEKWNIFQNEFFTFVSLHEKQAIILFFLNKTFYFHIYRQQSDPDLFHLI